MGAIQKMTKYEKLCEVVGIKQKTFLTKLGDRIFKYPNFAAEKQIELIKLLMNAGCFTGYAYKTEDKQYILSYALKNYHNEDFAEALAGLTLQLIEAGELDKKQVKEVLEQ